MSDVEGEAICVDPAIGIDLRFAVDLQIQLVLAVVNLPPLTSTFE